MKTEKEKKGIIYQVDVLKLTIKICKSTEELEFTPTFEDFNISQCESKQNLGSKVGRSPKLFGYYVYFETNEEATEYIKTLYGI